MSTAMTTGKKTLIIKGHKIFTNVSTVFKNKRRKGCSSVRHVEIVQDDNCYSEAQCSVAHVWVTRPADRPPHCWARVSAFEWVCVSERDFWIDAESLVVCDSPAMVRLLLLMAAVWIDGFVNGQRSDRQTFNSVSIYNRSNVPKKGGWRWEKKQIINRIDKRGIRCGEIGDKNQTILTH